MPEVLHVRFSTSFVVLRPPEAQAYAEAVKQLEVLLAASDELTEVSLVSDAETHYVKVVFIVEAPSFAAANVKSMRCLLRAIDQAEITADRFDVPDGPSALGDLDRIADEHLDDRFRQMLLVS